MEWQPTPVFLPGEFHGQRSLAGYSPWGHKESDRTERLTLSLSREPKWEVRVEVSGWICSAGTLASVRWSHYGNFSTLIYPLYEKEQIFTSLKLSDHLRPGVNGGQVEEGSWFSKDKWPRMLREWEEEGLGALLQEGVLFCWNPFCSPRKEMLPFNWYGPCDRGADLTYFLARTKCYFWL